MKPRVYIDTSVVGGFFDEHLAKVNIDEKILGIASYNDAYHIILVFLGDFVT